MVNEQTKTPMTIMTIEQARQNLENLINTINLVHKDYEVLVESLQILYEAAKGKKTE